MRGLNIFIFLCTLHSSKYNEYTHTHTHSKNNNKIVRLPSIAYLCRRRCRCRRIVHAANCTNAVGKKRGCWKFMIITSAQSEPARPTPLRLARAYTIQLAGWLLATVIFRSYMHAMHARSPRAPSAKRVYMCCVVGDLSTEQPVRIIVHDFPFAATTRDAHTAYSVYLRVDYTKPRNRCARVAFRGADSIGALRGSRA